MSFKPAFSLSSFTFIKGLFNSSSLSFIGVVSLWQKRAASCNFGILAGDDHRSFCSAILMIMEKWRPLKISAPKKKCSYTGGTSGKEPTCRCRRRKRCKFDPWVRKIPWGRAWQPTPVILPGEVHGQRSLVGYSPWGRKSRTQLSDQHFHFLSCKKELLLLRKLVLS